MDIGNIYNIKTSKGLGFLQLIKIPDSNNHVELTRVFYELRDSVPENLNDIAFGDFFLLEFPIKAGIQQNVLQFVGNVDLPEGFVFPTFFRSENLFGPGWRIINVNGGQKVVEELNEQELRYSPYGVWNAPLLIENLENGWRLENWR
mgnify:CR=1 FL=1